MLVMWVVHVYDNILIHGKESLSLLAFWLVEVKCYLRSTKIKLQNLKIFMLTRYLNIVMMDTFILGIKVYHIKRTFVGGC